MAGTNYNAKELVNVYISLTDEDNFATTAQCNGDPNVVANQSGKYQVGCIMRRMDLSSGHVLYENTGGVFGPVWKIIGQALIGRTSGNISNPPPLGTTETWLGEDAGLGSSTDATTFIGVNAGANSPDASEFTAIGYNAGYSFDGFSSTVIGINAGVFVTNTTGATMIGQLAGYSSDFATNSMFIGVGAGGGSSSSTNSLFFGEGAGSATSNASRCIFIGKSAGASDTIDTSLGGWAILIGNTTYTSGNKDVIVLGSNAAASREGQLMISDDVDKMHLNLEAYDDDAAAGLAGLVAGDWYQTTGSGPITTPGVVVIKQ